MHSTLHIGIMHYTSTEKRIGGVMVTSIVPASSAVDRCFETRLDQTKDYKKWYLLLLRYTHSIKEKEQRLVVPESG